MAWIQRISKLSQLEKEGFFRILIPPSLFHRFWINPLSFCDDSGNKAVRVFCPFGDRTCLVEIKLPGMDDPLYSIQVSDTQDSTQIELDFVVVNDPKSQKFNTLVDEDGRDTLFGWASRMLDEEEKALNNRLFPGQVRKGLSLTREVIESLTTFCRIFDIKSIQLEALFYHNAITYERYGFGYFSHYKEMKRINQLFKVGGKLFERLDDSSPFRKREFSQIVGGRSWAIHDGILAGINDDLLEEGWVSPTMYRMIDNPRPMVTFPEPRYW